VQTVPPNFSLHRRAAVRWPGAGAPRALQASTGELRWQVKAARGWANDPLGGREHRVAKT